MLKHRGELSVDNLTHPAAFRRLGVETNNIFFIFDLHLQPPSGGCVLKPMFAVPGALSVRPAAFRRLCVETRF